MGKCLINSSRRDFLTSAATSFAILSLLETAFLQNAIAASIRPTLSKWLSQINEISHSVKQQKISQQEWQSAVESLYDRIPLDDFLKFIDFDKVAQSTNHTSNGESFVDFVFPKVDGIPAKTFFYKDMAGFRKGCSIPPHGHNHLVSSFLVLNGSLHGRHFDRIEDEDESLTIRPTIDRRFQKGDFSTVSQTKDNIHWFTALEDNTFIIDFGVSNLKPSGSMQPLPHQQPLKSGRIYLDIAKSHTLDESGNLRTQRISETQAYQIYGFERSVKST